VGVSCCPVLPGITDQPQDLEAVIRAAAEAGADHLFANPLFLKPSSAAVFLPFIEQNFPHLVENYRERYRDRAFLPDSYGKRLSQLVRRLREKYKLIPDPRRKELKYAQKWPAQSFEEQLNLF
jgi:DNA repair photolyase